MPAGRVPSAEYWLKLSQINWHDLFYSKGSSGVQVFLDLKARIEKELKPDFLLIDSRTGITEMGGVATTLLPDRIICMVLPTPENLDGARAVLRSFKRSTREIGGRAVEITIALSRLPQMKEDYSERDLTEQIRAMMNEDAPNLEDTINCNEIFVLHSEAALQWREVLRVGSGTSPDESILLRDYLRLFANIVPRELIEPKFGRLIEDAKHKMWSDPDAAVKEIEELAESFGHPETYRALLLFYGVRNVAGAPALKRAQRLWELTRDAGELLLWDILKKNFEPKQRARVEWSPNLDFVESVWRSAGEWDQEFGKKIADAYNLGDKSSRAADIWLEVIEHGGDSPANVARCLTQLGRAERFKDAEGLVARFKEGLSGDPEFLEAWAKHALLRRDSTFVEELVDAPFFKLLGQVAPSTAARLLLRAGRKEVAGNYLDSAFRVAARRGEVDEFVEIGRLYEEFGQLEVFEKRIESEFPDNIAHEVMANIRRRRRVSSPHRFF